MNVTRAQRLVMWALALVGGLAVGVFGTLWHRVSLPWGLIVVIALTLIAAVCSRMIAGFGGLVAYGIGWLVSVQVMSFLTPAGSVLVVDSSFPYGGYAGYAWLFGGVVSFLLVVVCPPSWFRGDAVVSRRKAESDPAVPARADSVDGDAPGH